MSKKLINILLVIVTILGAVLRLTYLNRLPAGFTPDEAAFGYNAYSLLLTGRDEWGTPAYKLFTQNLRSFGDYKLPLYAFLAVPSVKFLGLTEMATRLPNVLFGILAIPTLYLLSRRLFARPEIALISAFIVAISPWHISLSRGAFESNLVTLFVPLAIYLFLKSQYWLSGLIFAINLYSYHSARLITPFVFIVLFIFYRRVNLKKLLPGLLLFSLLAIPAGMSYLGVGQGRLADVSLFHPTDNWSGVADRRFQDAQAGLPDSLSRTFNNKITWSTRELVSGYLSYLSPQFLFTNGAGEATYGMIPGRGLFYLLDLPFVVLALYLIARRPNQSLLAILSLILVGPLPAAFAKGLGFSANRAAPMFPFVVLLLSWSIFQAIIFVGRLKVAFVLFAAAIYFISLAFFAEDYLYHAPRLNAPSMSYGWAQAINRFKPISSQYAQVKVSRSFSEAQIFIAFYWPIPPADYQAASASWSDFDKKGFRFLDQYDGYRLGIFRFGNLNPQDSVDVPTLLIGKPDEFPDKFPYYFQIFSPTGLPAMQISSKKP